MRVAVSAFLLASLAACTDQGPPSTVVVLVTEGDRQVARAGTMLPSPVAVTVLDESGRPLEGERVVWQTDGGGLITPFNSVTDKQGTSRARWILGSEEGVWTATAALAGAATAVITAVAESPDALPFDAPAVLSIPTHDGSWQVVHPDYAVTPAGIFGTAYHLAITPYPQGDARLENPSLFAATRLDLWGLEPSAPNPVVLPGRVSLRSRSRLRARRARALALLPPGGGRQHRAAPPLRRRDPVDPAPGSGAGAQPRPREPVGGASGRR